MVGALDGGLVQGRQLPSDVPPGDGELQECQLGPHPPAADRVHWGQENVFCRLVVDYRSKSFGTLIKAF